MRRIALALFWLCQIICSPAHAQPAVAWHTPEGLFHHNIWPTLRHHFELDHYTDRKVVQKYIHWWQTHPQSLQQTLQQAAPYLQYIYNRTQSRNLPAELALIPFVESRYQVFAYSNAGAVGLWQMMPGTATGQGLKINWWYDGRRDVVASTRAALNYLTYLYQYFNQHWLYAIAAYDAGEGTLYKAINHNRHRHASTNFWDLPLPYETQNYIPQLLAICAIIDDPDAYGVTLPYVSAAPYFVTVDLDQQMDLSQAAQLADISPLKLRYLNPGFKRWATDPLGPHQIVLPMHKADDFIQALGKLAAKDYTPWYHHVVNEGETLSGIAHHYHTTLTNLKKINHLTSMLIKPGQHLLVPGDHKGMLPKTTGPHAVKALTATISTPSGLHPTILSGANVPGPQQVIYEVKNRDTLGTIAARYHLKPSQITYWNHLRSPIIHTHQKLVLWIKNRHGRRSYTVKAGDTLSGIAVRYGTPIQKIVKLNHLSSTQIRTGQRLVIA